MSALPNNVLNIADARMEEVQSEILGLVSQGTSLPSEVLEKLSQKHGDYLIKEGLLRLLREGRLSLTPDRKLLRA